MLDIRLLREKPDYVKERLATRGGDFAAQVSEVLSIDEQRRAAETERQKLQSDRNRISKEIGMAKKKGEDTSAIEAEVRGIGERIDQIGKDADALDARQKDIMLGIPNLPHDGCPIGHSAEENPEVRVWGDKPSYGFQPKDHIALGNTLGILDFEAGTKISGRLKKLDSVRVGKFTVNDVECAVLGPEATEATPLLGMSFLGQFKFELNSQAAELSLMQIDEESKSKPTRRTRTSAKKNSGSRKDPPADKVTTPESP